jgi:hypothetical protein
VSNVRNLWILLAVAAIHAGSCRKDVPTEEPPMEEAPAAEAPAASPPTAASPATQAPARPAPAQEDEASTPPAADPVAAVPEPAAPSTPEASAPEAEPAPEPAPQAERPRPAGAPAAPPLPDLRLLLTTTDIESLSAGKGTLRRTSLAGVPPSAHADGLLYEPAKGTAYGVGIQVFREDNAALARDRFNGMLASYPSAQEIAAVAGRTFFAYWDDVMFLGFIQPARNLVIVLSCGRTYCTSDGLYELARKVSARSGS